MGLSEVVSMAFVFSGSSALGCLVRVQINKGLICVNEMSFCN